MIVKSETNKILYYANNLSGSTIWTNLIVNDSERMVLIGDTIIESDIIINGEVLCL